MIDRSDRFQARLFTLRAVSRALARPLDAIEVLRAVHAELAKSIDATICFFGLYDASGQTVDVIWQIHDGLELPGGHFPLGTGATSQAIRECTPRLIRCWSKEGPPVKVQYATDRPALPESSITVPVVFDGEVMGVLSIQAYEPEAYDQQDVVLVQSIADLVAMALSAKRPQHGQEGEILASMADALLVLDDQGRLVRINQAARRMLSLEDSSLILGQPVDRPQADRWPLGTRGLTEQLRPIVEQLKRGAAPRHEVQLALDGMPDHKVSCRASVLMHEGSPAGGVVVLRELAATGGS